MILLLLKIKNIDSQSESILL